MCLSLLKCNTLLCALQEYQYTSTRLPTIHYTATVHTSLQSVELCTCYLLTAMELFLPCSCFYSTNKTSPWITSDIKQKFLSVKKPVKSSWESVSAVWTKCNALNQECINQHGLIFKKVSQYETNCVIHITTQHEVTINDRAVVTVTSHNSIFSFFIFYPALFMYQIL